MIIRNTFKVMTKKIVSIFYRFLPDGAYLDAIALGPTNLAKLMNKIIHNKDRYYDFFRWHEYYSYHKTDEFADTDELCAFCALLNNMTLNPKTYFYKNITEFWNSNSNEDLMNSLRSNYY